MLSYCTYALSKAAYLSRDSVRLQDSQQTAARRTDILCRLGEMENLKFERGGGRYIVTEPVYLMLYGCQARALMIEQPRFGPRPRQDFFFHSVLICYGAHSASYRGEGGTGGSLLCGKASGDRS